MSYALCMSHHQCRICSLDNFLFNTGNNLELEDKTMKLGRCLYHRLNPIPKPRFCIDLKNGKLYTLRETINSNSKPVNYETNYKRNLSEFKV